MALTETDKPLLIMLAGSNGSGKTTFYHAFLSHLGLPFINADALAQKLNLEAYAAAALAERIRRIHVEQGRSFVSETVFSDPEGVKIEFRLVANYRHGRKTAIL